MSCNILAANSLCKMKFSVILVLFSIGLSKCNDLKCGYLVEIDSVEFYCEKYIGPVPTKCSAAFFESLNQQEKLKVIRLKVRSCNHDKIEELVNAFSNLQSLDISQSGLSSLEPFDLQHEHLQKINVSHNQIRKVPDSFFLNLPNLIDMDFSHNSAATLYNLEGHIDLDFILWYIHRGVFWSYHGKIFKLLIISIITDEG